MKINSNIKSGLVRDIITRTRRVMIAARLILGLLVWAGLCLGIWLALFLLDNFLHLPAGLRLALSLAGLGLMVFLLWRDILTPALQPQGMETTALLLEEKYAVPENILINALQFETRGTGKPRRHDQRDYRYLFTSGEIPFAHRTIRTGLSLMANAPARELWPFRKIGYWSAVFIMLVIAWVFYGIVQDQYALNALTRFVRPLADVPPIGSVLLQVTPTDDISLAQGDNLPVSIKVKAPGKNISAKGVRVNGRCHPEIIWMEGADYISPEMDRNKCAIIRVKDEGRGVYSYTFTGVKRSFAFRVFAADTYSRSIRVTVNAAPRIRESQFHISPPAYTGVSRISGMGPPQPVSALAGARLEVEIKLDKQPEQLFWNGPSDTIVFERERQLWRAETVLNQTGPYEVEVKGRGIDKRIKIAAGSITLQQDRPPDIDFLTLERNRKVNPGDILKLELQASDDFGIREILTVVRPARDSQRIMEETDQRGKTSGETSGKTAKQWTYKGPPGKKGPLKETLFLPIDARQFEPGLSYVLEAICKDFSPSGNTGKSPSILLQVRSLEELTISNDDPHSRAFAELEAAIQAQQTALGITRNVAANLDDILVENTKDSENRKSLRKHQEQMEEKQKRVGWHLNRAWKVSRKPRPAFVHKMISLRDAEQVRAVEKIRSVMGIKKSEKIIKTTTMRSLNSIERLQEFILSRLIELKGQVAGQSLIEAEKASAEILGETNEIPGSDLEDALENMVRELDDFITQQKDIIYKRNMITDQPPEDFSEDDEDDLEKLAIDQSKLAQILAQVVNDLTNMNLLDFGDNSMVESMKSIYQEADALADKAQEAADMRQIRVDAHRLETETVEMAEEIMINCEAVLGFYDNIQFVAEIPEDEQLVAPLAELPYELEDIVGDLITSEEEMRQEVEDIGSYLNSLDHTAGPVSDGTISSTSAKGLTGDQKPEDNIIQGRSGAGRSGMSDGQLVEPVAKALPDNEYGLRERISSTPLESGRVKDEDITAQTGGTGLGKTTDGASIFGMGGKLPPRVLEMMKAAVLKQQAVRQSAQNLAGKLKSHNLSGTGMEKSIQAMKKVEDAIQGYDGVGIRRAYNETLNALKKTHRQVHERVAVQNIGKRVPAEKINNTLSQQQLARFHGYEQMINAYFEALARTSQKKPEYIK